MEQNAKPWWQSTTIWGALVSAVCGLLAMVGYTVSAADQATMTSSLQQLASLIVAVGTIAGPVLTVVGRVRASKHLSRQIVPGGPPPGVTNLMLTAVALGLIATALSACTTASLGTFGRAAIRIGEAAYQVECKNLAPQAFGGSVAVVATIFAPDTKAAARIRAGVDRNNELIAQACPLARSVEIVVSTL